eukprot:133437-Hanusia_phi.AAC.1
MSRGVERREERVGEGRREEGARSMIGEMRRDTGEGGRGAGLPPRRFYFFLDYRRDICLVFYPVLVMIVLFFFYCSIALTEVGNFMLAS